MAKSKNFVFDGGAGTYLGTAILAFFITVLTLGIAYPYALVLMQRWKAKHTYIKGFQLKWFFLTIITLGIYGFWVYPRLQRWIVEHTDFSEKRPVSPKLEHSTTK